MPSTPLVSGTTPNTDSKIYYDEGDIRWINTGDLNDGYLSETKKKVSRAALEELSALRVYPSGSLIVAMYGATIGKLAITAIEGCTNQACAVLAESSVIDIRYAFFIFGLQAAHPNISLWGYQPNIFNQELIRSLRLPCPAMEEQRAIAAFLDLKTAQLDQLVAQKQQMLRLLQEERAALINQAVTQGLDAAAPRRHSGIEWLGEVPAHWEVKRLKFVLKQPLKYGANEAAELQDTTLPRYIRITDFGDDGILKEDTFRSLPEEIAADYLLEDGDILFARSGATVGKTFQLRNYTGKACFAGYLIKATADENEVLADFLYAYTKSGGYNSWKESIFIQATIQNIGADKYSSLPVPVPPLDEQHKILDFLNGHGHKTTLAIDVINQEITLLQEYRAALIAEAVTGQIDVRDYKLATA